MSNINSFKCDICGEVYHVTEGVPNEYITMHKHCVSDDEGEVTSYRHICPTCEGHIRNFIADPTFIDEQEKELCKTIKFNTSLKSFLNSIHYAAFGWSSFCGMHANVEDYENDAKIIKEKIKDVKDELSDVRDGLVDRVNKQLWTIRILACLLGACIGSILVLISM